MSVPGPREERRRGGEGHGVGVKYVELVGDRLADEEIQFQSVGVDKGVSLWGIASTGDVDTGLGAFAGGDKGRRVVRRGCGELGVGNEVPGLGGGHQSGDSYEERRNGGNGEFHDGF